MLPLLREGITDLDHALYCASCFAGNAPDDVVSIMYAADDQNEEHYEILDGRQGPRHASGLDWTPCYYLERAPD